MFAENGLAAYKAGQVIHIQSFKAHLGEEKLKQLLNFILHYIADLDIPIKRGTFVEFRSGMINVSPIGRNCSQAEREEFLEYDNRTGVRWAELTASPVSSICAGAETSNHALLAHLLTPRRLAVQHALQHASWESACKLHACGCHMHSVKATLKAPSTTAQQLDEDAATLTSASGAGRNLWRCSRPSSQTSA